MRKSLKITIFITVMAILITALEVGYCKYKISQAKDMSLLFINNGVVYSKTTNQPYTGFAYLSLCGNQCSFLGCPPVHYYKHFKNGLLQGDSYLPSNNNSNGYFIFSLFSKPKLVVY